MREREVGRESEGGDRVWLGAGRLDFVCAFDWVLVEFTGSVTNNLLNCGQLRRGKWRTSGLESVGSVNIYRATHERLDDINYL